ncbi:GntR family transcriptional regulator [Paenibacillus pinistramenti]|uniref:GntR family transcriptional regulator n=1 Tax=Paenibacillus pinistramenti TaxID=1768003 RepID=UPI0011088CB3|nr:GntR family transcriptional regulator [Paenibacillus pinistramenti]
MRYPAVWLQGTSLGEAVASELRLQIINGTIKPGEVLSENRIAADFGTSRSPVREAMRTLSAEGLIRLERMGAVVIGLQAKDRDELYDVRYLIESFAQQRLAGMETTGLIERLGRIIDRMELAAKHQDIVEFAYQDLTFHETIVLEANHTRINHLWNSIRHIVMTVLLITTGDVFSAGEANISRVINKHHKLMNALKSKETAVIQQQVEEYFADSRNTLQRSLPSS